MEPRARELVGALLRGDVGFTLGCRLWLCWRLLVAPQTACATLITLTAQGMSARQGENSRSEVEGDSPPARSGEA